MLSSARTSGGSTQCSGGAGPTVSGSGRTETSNPIGAAQFGRTCHTAEKICRRLEVGCDRRIASGIDWRFLDVAIAPGSEERKSDRKRDRIESHTLTDGE